MNSVEFLNSMLIFRDTILSKLVVTVFFILVLKVKGLVSK